jgi:hypothetical protein
MPEKEQPLFADLNFAALREDPDFKEDSVRELIVMPLLKNWATTATLLSALKTWNILS